MIIYFSHFIRGVPKGGGQLKFKTSAALRLYPLVGKARGVIPEDNPEPNSLRLSGADFGILLETYSAVRDCPVVLNIDRACAPAPR